MIGSAYYLTVLWSYTTVIIEEALKTILKKGKRWCNW